MATDFRSSATGELAFVRYYGGRTDGVMYEFGTVSNFERVRSASTRTATFVADDGEVLNLTRDELNRMVGAGRASFGRMGMTLEVGSGDLFNMTVEE